MIINDLAAIADRVCQLVAKKSKLSLPEIVKCIECKDSSVLLAIGWLRRENKIRISENNGVILIEPNDLFPETYY